MRAIGENKIVTKTLMRLACVLLPVLLAVACAPAIAPDGRTPSIPTAKSPDERFEGLNERRDPVTRVHLGKDILMPQPLREDPLPETLVGPFELRNETLASALQLILDEYDIALAFQGDQGLRSRVTISNLRGKLGDVVHKVCAVADLYCHFEGGTLTVKKTETFVVDLPPINVVAAAASSSGGSGSGSSSAGSSSAADGAASAAPASGSSSGTSSGAAATTNDAYTQIANGLAAVLTMEDPSVTARPVVDTSTRVMIYSATQRGNKAAGQYFSRLRKNTALIIFETHIWEVTLNNDSSTGINWDGLTAGATIATAGNFSIRSAVSNALPAIAGRAGPITITPTWTGGSGFSASAVLSFISDHGAVKTISQPQITVLSGSQASLAVSQNDNYVSGSSTTGLGQVGVTPTTTIQTATTTTGLNMNISSAWDQSTVYGAINITLNNLIRVDTFNSPDGSSRVQLPHTTSRSIGTEIRVRPGDSVLIGGLVSQADQLTTSGPGILTPLFTTSKATSKVNTELVFLLRPRIVSFEMGDNSDTPRIVNAPKDGMFPSEQIPRKFPGAANKVSGDTPVSAPRKAVKNQEPLPEGISPEAFAPKDAAPENIPAESRDRGPPVPLSKKPATGSGRGVNQ
jgi:hypothetical protein